MVALTCSVPVLIYLLIVISRAVSTGRIDCDELSDKELRNASTIVDACKDSLSLGRDATATKPLDISSLSDVEFKLLFNKKQSLNMGIQAVNSKIVNMTFPSLKVFDDQKSSNMLLVKNNRLLKEIRFPLLPNRTLRSSFDPSNMPICVKGNPLISQDNINYFRSLVHGDLDWNSHYAPNNHRICMLTHIIRDMKDLDNCEVIDSSLIIDEAVGETTAQIREVYGNISITNSNISDIDFLRPGAWPETPSIFLPERYDVIHNNPNLCVSDEQLNKFKLRKTSPSVLNNKNKHLCVQPAEAICMGGSLSDDDTRTRIEKRNCTVIQGELLIENVINSEIDLTVQLIDGLSRIRQIVDGSLVVTNNDGLYDFDFMKGLAVVSPGRSDNCKAPGIAIWCNFNLRSLKLNTNISVYDNAERCTQIYIGANGEEGRERVISDEDYEQLGNNVKGIIIWNHPRDRKAVEKEDEEMVRLYWSIGCCVASTILGILGGSFYFYKMSHVKDSDENESSNKSETGKDI